MDSSNGKAYYKLEAIRTAIENGTLTKEEMYARLERAILEEHQKKPEECDDEFILFCEKILYEMSTGKPYISRKDESKKILFNNLKITPIQHNTPTVIKHKKCVAAKRFVGIILAAVILLVSLSLLDVIIPIEWLHGSQSVDEQEYVISGEKNNLGVVEHGQAEDAKTRQTLITSDLDEAISFLESAPLMPSWIPSGWKIEGYYVKKTPVVTTFRVTYQNPADEELLRFDMHQYKDADKAFAEFQQSAAGISIECNHWTVYISENIDIPFAIWHEDLMCWSLSGPVSKSDLLAIINSIQRSD